MPKLKRIKSIINNNKLVLKIKAMRKNPLLDIIYSEKDFSFFCY